MTNFEPVVVAFCCRHCAYAAADLAGSARIAYPSAVKIVELPCTGRLDVLEVLHAFEAGADGVLVAGCLPGACHYVKGNLYARQRVSAVADLLKEIGLDGERARMINVSAAMGARFAESVTDFVNSLQMLGPSPLSRRHAAELEGVR